ncbi:MAG TPA: hypothetical protein VLR91_08140, partial [Thermodesulfobacteriota bacterium]|nr:hypothetical protein [Thermodesulfobacteriota bacterium]
GLSFSGFKGLAQEEPAFIQDIDVPVQVASVIFFPVQASMDFLNPAVRRSERDKPGGSGPGARAGNNKEEATSKK